jgi:hypothetical protein
LPGLAVVQEVLDRITRTQQRAAHIHAKHTACVIVYDGRVLSQCLPLELHQEPLSTGMRFRAAAITSRPAADQEGLRNAAMPL